MRDLRAVATEGEHAGFDAHGFELGAVEIFGAASELVKVHLGVNVHLAGVDLHDLRSSIFVRMRELDLTVESTGAHERGIENIGSVRGGDDFDSIVAREPIELIKEL